MVARLRWQMNGFNRSRARPPPVDGPQLMGQIDGTRNPKPAETDFEQRVFVPGSGEPDWMAHGSYAVVRRIRMLLDDWEKLSLKAQEDVIGRRKSDGAPSAAAPRPPRWTWRRRPPTARSWCP